MSKYHSHTVDGEGNIWVTYEVEVSEPRRIYQAYCIVAPGQDTPTYGMKVHTGDTPEAVRAKISTPEAPPAGAPVGPFSQEARDRLDDAMMVVCRELDASPLESDDHVRNALMNFIGYARPATKSRLLQLLDGEK